MRIKKIIYLFFITAIISAVFYAAHRFLQDYSVHQIINELNSISLQKEIMAFLLSAVSYIFLTVYDFLGLKYLGRKLAPMYVMTTSFISYAFSNSIGLSILASSSLRYRYYSYYGLTFGEITKIILFTTMTLWAGILSVGGFAFCFGPGVTLPGNLLGYVSTRYIGAVFLAAVFLYLVILALRHNKPIGFYGRVLELPKLSIGVLQILVGGADWILAGTVLYVLLPDQVHIAFLSFIGIYLMAQTIGLMSHVPGGAVVFEGVLLSFFPKAVIPQIIGSLLVYRVAYYIFPLLTATFVIGLSEYYRSREKVSRYYSVINKIYVAAIPNLLFIIVFLCGSYMFIKGALPINPVRFPLVREIFPLPLVESSHFLESLIGLCLIIISRGLKMRVDFAFQLTVILLAAGTVFGIIKGAEYETAMFSIAIILSLLPVRSLFSRKSSFFTGVMTKEWLFSIVVILCVFIWVGFFSYKHVEYRDSLWWTFTFNDHAPRFLRALVGAVAVVIALILYTFMQPSKRMADDNEDTEHIVGRIVPANAESYAYLAYLPDKKYLFSESGNAFIMYGVSGRSFISMGDPVSTDDNAETFGGLIGDFRRQAAQHGCNSAFYEIGAKYIPHYIDSGYKIFKIGEEAKVNLSTFTLSGGHWSGTRNTIKKIERNNCEMRIIPDDKLADVMPDLKRISDQWLKSKNTREKKFSLGRFDENYLAKTRIAAVFCGEKPMAFANLWMTNNKNEMSVDLMRYSSDAPSGVMEYLFVKLMLMGQQEGFRYFNLGMAPLSGINATPYSPLWNKVAGIIYKHAETFYNFKGLRSYKDKFRPEWEPKYIAVHGFLALSKTLTNVTSLISGSAAGIFIK